MRVILALITSILFPLLAPVAAHEGHDHGEAPRMLVPAAPRGEAQAGDFELVAVLRGGEVVIYLDRFATNEPVTNAQVEALTPAGNEKAVAKDDGSYRLPAKWTGTKDRYDLIFTVTLGENSEVLPVTIVAPANSEAAAARNVSLRTAATLAILAALLAFAAAILAVRRYPQLIKAKAFGVAALVLAAFVSPAGSHEGDNNNNNRPVLQGGRDVSQRLPDGSVFMPKTVQRLLVVRTAIVKEGEHPKTIELPGRVIPDANASGYVQSSLAGRLLPPPNGFPALGSRVEKGQVLAYIEPPIQAIDVSDMRQKEGELSQQIAIVERRVMRFDA